jgi:hypothetical protein
MKAHSYRAAAAVAAALSALATGPATANAAPAPVSDAGPAVAASDSPRTVGKIFFTANGKQHECTGNVVESQNRDVISTAGSCLYFREGSGDAGAYVSDLTFIPGYHNGERPYGTWSARQMAVTSSWQQSGGGLNSGFAVLNTLNGQHIQDVVGGSPIRLGGFANLPPILNNHFLGYGIGGGELVRCESGSPSDCDMGAAASVGAPIILAETMEQYSQSQGQGSDPQGFYTDWNDEVTSTFNYAQVR